MLAGYILQTNEVSIPVLLVAASTGFLSLVEIKASRPYKELKRMSPEADSPERTRITEKLEGVLKFLSLGVISLGIGLLLWRWPG